jgi:hypothetical protein
MPRYIYIPIARPQRRKEIVYHPQNPIKGLSEEDRKELFWSLICIGALFLVGFAIILKMEVK